MRNKNLHVLLFFFLLLLLLIAVRSLFADSSPAIKPSPVSSLPGVSSNKVYLIKIDAAITPVVTEYINKSIETASQNKAEAILILLDTPGGLVDSMREIVKKMMSADVPVIVYVAPAGSRAASAGVFITLAANISAMAPSTHIGAAHPVTMEGAKMDATMETKVVNDLSAMMRGIAEKRNKNAAWAENAVRNSVSITENEALKDHVIDLVSPDVPALLKAINGKTVTLMLGNRTLHTAGAEIKEISMGFRYRLLEIISNPNIAYILMILGFYGLYFELANPGAIFPGVVGAISLILAFYALHTLPINYAGLMLIILGIGLFIAEAFITSHGVLGLGGAVAMLFGSLMLIDSTAPVLQISWTVIIPAIAMSALLFIITVTVAIRVQREKVDTGKEGMINHQAEARSDILTDGQVFIHGEYWSAWSDEPIQKGDKVIVLGMEGLKLKVRKI